MDFATGRLPRRLTFTAPRLFAPTLIALALLGGGGCSHSNGRLAFQSRATGRELFEQFNSAYISDSRDGEYDVVLLNDETRLARPQLSRAPLEPIRQPPLRQVLRVHVFWRPTSGHVAQERSVTNASLDWFLYGNDSRRSGDLLRYEGAAYVTVAPGPGTADVTVRAGRVEPTRVQGAVRDAIGPAIISGTITAVRNDARVREVVKAMDALIETKPATRPTTAATPDGRP